MSKPSNLPAIEVLSSLFVIDETSPSGLRRSKDGAIAGTLHSQDRYWYAKVQKKRHACHRIILALVTGYDCPELTVDHINRNGLDNRIQNLRWATSSDQAKNRQTRRVTYPQKWGWRWVKFEKNAFVAGYTMNGKRFYAGRYKTAQEAHLMACAHRLERFWAVEVL